MPSPCSLQQLELGSKGLDLKLKYQGSLGPESNSALNLWPQEFQNAHGLNKPRKF